MKHLIDTYDVENDHYKAQAMKQIDDLWSELEPSKSTIDPQRIGSKSVFISKLKYALMDKAGSVVTDHKEFDKLDPKEQLKFQMKSIQNGENKWVWDVDVVPKNIENFGLSHIEVDLLKKQRTKVDKDKLEGDVIEVNGNILLNSMMPLLNRRSLYSAVVPALLLATGRRSIEILKTGDFYITKEMDVNGYVCMFSGQAKQGLTEQDPYLITLLAPFKMVKRALNTVRTEFDATKMTTAEVHQKFAKSLSNWVKKLAGTTPHMLRSIYAMMCYKLRKSKQSLIGFISKLLGHTQVQNAMYYHRVSIENLTGPYTPTEEDEPEEEPEVLNREEEKEEDVWVANSVPEKKRLETIKELMLRNRKITASSVRAYGGGTMAVIQRVIDNNLIRINEYNDSLQ
jgi:hypothetical protein